MLSSINGFKPAKPRVRGRGVDGARNFRQVGRYSFFVRLVLPESARSTFLDEAPEVVDQIAQVPLAIPSCIVQHGRSRS